jgi:DNA polymerase-3 subunit delta'
MAKKKTTRKKAPKRTTIKDNRPDVMMYDAPIGLDRVEGQQRALGVLNQATQSGRLHHAWIFHGPEGVGKFTAALSWAAMLLDPSSAPDLSGNIAPDPDSHTQQLIRSGTHPDFHVIRKELTPFARNPNIRSNKQRTIPKDILVEYLVEPAALAPSMSEGANAGKVFIIDEAELIGREGQNAILKTLEEPGPGTLIILVTSSEDRLLPTIRSRCQRVGFTPLDDESMRRWVSTRDFSLSPEAHNWYTLYADGSPGRFARAASSDLYSWHTQIDPMLTRAMRGDHPAGLGTLMSSLIDTWASDWVKQGDKLGENRSKDAANQKGTDMMLALVAQRAQSGLTDPSRADSSLRTIDSVTRATESLRTNVSFKMVMEHLVAGISDKG